MPIIGISCGYRNKTEDKVGIQSNYIDVIKQAGGTPVILPPQLTKDNIKILGDCVNGILLSGGADINPLFYNKEPDFNLNRIDPSRDEYEIELVKWCLKNKIPLLAICRGMQLLNIVCGGTIIQNLSNAYLKHRQNTAGYYPTHSVILNRDTILLKIYGVREIKVNRFHHQAIDNIGSNLIIAARANDDIIEGLVVKDHPFAVGVQWHPEKMAHSNQGQNKIFDKFIEKCCN